MRRPLRDHLLGRIAIRLPGDAGDTDARCQQHRGEGAHRAPADRPKAARGQDIVDGRGAKRRIDLGDCRAGRDVGCSAGLRLRKTARGIVQEIGKLFIRGRDRNGIGRDHHDIVRIVGLFRLRRGMHWRSPAQSNVTGTSRGRRIYASSTRVLPHTSLRFDQRKAGRWRLWGRGNPRFLLLGGC